MSFINKRNERLNAEGYVDTTAFQAIKNVEGLGRYSDPYLYYYVKKKLEMLMAEFLVTPTQEEVDELFNLTSEKAIDKKVVHIIKKHWEEEN